MKNQNISQFSSLKIRLYLILLSSLALMYTIIDALIYKVSISPAILNIFVFFSSIIIFTSFYSWVMVLIEEKKKLEIKEKDEKSFFVVMETSYFIEKSEKTWKVKKHQKNLVEFEFNLN